MALMMAAMMPSRPARTEKMLTMPPRLRTESERRMPRLPRRMAATARRRPKVAPWKKLAMAAMTARIAGMLKAGFDDSLMGEVTR
jgi:hypothetical protein